MSLWEWITGGGSPSNLRATPAAPAATPSPSAAAAAPSPSAAAVAATPAPSAPSSALVPASTALTTTTTAAPSAVPVDGFWGFTSEKNVHADDDPALDDMLQFYGFAHRRAHEYSGAVCFKLTYPDGSECTRTVQVLPLGQSQEEQQHQRDEALVEEMAHNKAATALAVQAKRPHARIRTYARTAQESSSSSSSASFSSVLASTVSSSIADPSTSTSTSTALVPFSSGRVPACLPAPCVALTIQTRVEDASSSALVASSSSGAIVPAVAVPALPLVSLPSSPRVRVYCGPVPSHVRLSATLSCPRSVFFDVYMGRTDPMHAVLTGQAHCSGYRYMSLLKFGQAFHLETNKWVDFYKEKDRVAEINAERRKMIAAAAGGGIGGGGPRTIEAAASSSPSSHHYSEIPDDIIGEDDQPRRRHRSRPLLGSASDTTFAPSPFGDSPAALAASMWRWARSHTSTSALPSSSSPPPPASLPSSSLARGFASSTPRRLTSSTLLHTVSSSALPLSRSMPGGSLLQLIKQVHATTEITFTADA